MTSFWVKPSHNALSMWLMAAYVWFVLDSWFFLVFLKSPSAANQAINVKYSDSLLKSTRKQKRQCGFLSRPRDDWWCYLSSFLADGLRKFLFQEKMTVKENHLIFLLFKISEYNTTLKYEFIIYNFPLLTFLDFRKSISPYPRKCPEFIISMKGFRLNKKGHTKTHISF